MTLELIVESLGFLIALITLVFSLNKTNKIQQDTLKIQQDTLMHDMVKEEISNWKYIHEEIAKQKNKVINPSAGVHIFNYYEYLAYLINNKKIDPKQAFNIWKPNIFGMYEDFKEKFLGNRNELKKLYYRWKSLEN